MKAVATLSCAALAHAFVLPDVNILARLGGKTHATASSSSSSSFSSFSSSSWLHRIPPKHVLAKPVADRLHDGAGSLTAQIRDALRSLDNTVGNTFEHLFDQDLVFHSRSDSDSDKTLYDVISECEHATQFTKLINQYDDLVAVLKSSDANHTVFVPTDSAFDHLPSHRKPSRDELEAILRYHIALGNYDVKRVLRTHTLPTLLNEPALGDKPQRLRTSLGLGGVRINFYAKVIAANVHAKNGIIHAVQNLIIPPPMIGRELTLLPSQFSTLLLAYEKTDFVKFIHGIQSNGTTIFAPSNRAFARLGPKANAFLFNTATGLKYLKALLKYHIVANATLYTDAFYRPGDDARSAKLMDHYHVDLPTLLDGKHIAVDVATWAGWTSIKLNGYIPLAVTDGIAKNGVVHVPARVPIPPRRHKVQTGVPAYYDVDAFDGEISVDELQERLAEYVVDDEDEEEDAHDSIIPIDTTTTTDATTTDTTDTTTTDTTTTTDQVGWLNAEL